MKGTKLMRGHQSMFSALAVNPGSVLVRRTARERSKGIFSHAPEPHVAFAPFLFTTRGTNNTTFGVSARPFC